MGLQLTVEQLHAVDEAVRTLALPPAQEQVLCIGGLAGSGKTTLVREILRRTDAAVMNVAVASFTGKAVHVLRSKGVHRAKTLHSLLYNPAFGDNEPYCDINDHQCKKRRFRFERKEDIDCGAVIIDEASMVSLKLYEDLLHYNVPLVFIGDHGQLDPIGADPGLMRRPDITLEKVHRQALDNPILKFAHGVRNGGSPGAYPYDAADERVHKVSRNQANDVLPDYDIVLCGYNKTRQWANERVRELKGFKGLLNERERVVALQNRSALGVYNGTFLTILKVHSVDGVTATCDVLTDNGRLNGLELAFAPPGATTDEEIPIDYGYASTVHKAQGSEWPSVLVLEELWDVWDARRWRYTAATRASEKLGWCRWQKWGL